LDGLPEGVKKVRLRSDGAGYAHNLLAYCDNGEHIRFGKIEFAISCPVTEVFKNEVSLLSDEEWKKLDSRREWAEVGFMPDELVKKGNDYRYLVIREPVRQPFLPGMELPFATLGQYKLRGLVSNMEWAGERLITFSYERCGKSEEAHAALKEDLAGGKLPSGGFGENAAWWWVMVLAFNLNTAMKQLALSDSFAAKRMKAIRFRLINLPGRIIDHARHLLIRIAKSHLTLLAEARLRIMALSG
jgi:hypothetical protein